MLTGLGNRLRFKRDAEALIGLGETFVLTLIDLDKFKSINDSEGHQAGDRVLVEVARRLRSQVSLDDTVDWLSGDEFVVLSRGAGERALRRLESTLLRAIRPPNARDRVSRVTRTSVGSAVFPDDAADLGRLLVAADVAMYSAKRAGGHAHYRYSRALHDEWERRSRLGQIMTTAFDEDAMDFVYQPIFETASHRLVGYEALLRWPECPLSDCSIGQLIGEVAAHGLLGRLTRWSVSRLLQDAPRLLDGRAGLFLAVNLMPAQAVDADARATNSRARSRRCAALTRDRSWN